jgi:hypothetical protein
MKNRPEKECLLLHTREEAATNNAELSANTLSDVTDRCVCDSRLKFGISLLLSHTTARKCGRFSTFVFINITVVQYKKILPNTHNSILQS